MTSKSFNIIQCQPFFKVLQLCTSVTHISEFVYYIYEQFYNIIFRVKTMRTSIQQPFGYAYVHLVRLTSTKIKLLVYKLNYLIFLIYKNYMTTNLHLN